MKKKFPEFKTDAEAETFVDTADLSEYDFSDMVPTSFELKPKNTAISLRLSDTLLREVRTHADRVGISYQSFIRLAVEQALKSSQRKKQH